MDYPLYIAVQDGVLRSVTTDRIRSEAPEFYDVWTLTEAEADCYVTRGATALAARLGLVVQA